jgi:hypothetical protein
MQYPLPIITDILHKRSGYKFFTKIDVIIRGGTDKIIKNIFFVCFSIVGSLDIYVNKINPNFH